MKCISDKESDEEFGEESDEEKFSRLFFTDLNSGN